MDVSLPKFKTVASQNLSDYSILFYGREKIGKTTLSAQFPDAFFLMCEPGSKSLEIYSRPVKTWDEFKQYARLLSTDTKFKTIVVDTVDLAALYCEKAVCAKAGIEYPGDLDHGKGWRMVSSEFAKNMAYLQALGKGVIFISHAKEREIKDRRGGSSHRTVPTMSGTALGVLEPMVDIYCYYQYDEDGKRTLLVRGNDKIAAGTRTRQNFVGVESIPAGGSAEETYQNFLAAFNNRLLEHLLSKTSKLRIKKG